MVNFFNVCKWFKFPNALSYISRVHCLTITNDKLHYLLKKPPTCELEPRIKNLEEEVLRLKLLMLNEAKKTDEILNLLKTTQNGNIKYIYELLEEI